VEYMISVTELDDFQRCPLHWYYRTRRGLKPIPEEVGGVNPMLSGSAIHFGLEAGLNTEGTADKKRLAGLQAAALYLETHGDESGRLKRGVEAALNAAPGYVWETENPVTEARTFLSYQEGDDLITLTGKPDVWSYDGNRILIEDYKSTSKDEWKKLEEYEAWNMQPRYYGVLLSKWLTLEKNLEYVPPVFTRHVVLSTRGRTAVGQPKLLTQDVYDEAEKRMLWQAREVVQRGHQSTPSLWKDAKVNPLCSWCEYAPIDLVALTGGDPESVISDAYQVEFRQYM
jgi:hypothetical protein